MKKLTVQIHRIKNAKLAEELAFRKAAMELETELNSQDFWADVQSHYSFWEDKYFCKEERRFHNFQDFKKNLMSGADKFNTEKDFDLDVSVSFYYSFRNVVGYTLPSTWFTWINRKLFKGFDLGDIAENIIHEYLHNFGLDHPGTNRDSVTYKFGNLVRDRIKRRLRLENNPVVLRRGFWGRVLNFFRRIF